MCSISANTKQCTRCRGKYFCITFKQENINYNFSSWNPLNNYVYFEKKIKCDMAENPVTWLKIQSLKNKIPLSNGTFDFAFKCSGAVFPVKDEMKQTFPLYTSSTSFLFSYNSLTVKKPAHSPWVMKSNNPIKTLLRVC